MFLCHATNILDSQDNLIDRIQWFSMTARCDDDGIWKAEYERVKTNADGNTLLEFQDWPDGSSHSFMFLETFTANVLSMEISGSDKNDDGSLRARDIRIKIGEPTNTGIRKVDTADFRKG